MMQDVRGTRLFAEREQSHARDDRVFAGKSARTTFLPELSPPQGADDRLQAYRDNADGPPNVCIWSP
jgi:hypothetical protein